ncbi:hypothetical protein F2Q68_00046480 [Brassica cretica]|uniref:Neprosin PEP catalytic domain-containing protein n=1 Tax=Brassica cretica TaxID=69181 RepID=A0A8S9LPS1_BRACR|nr:hypothetical protein F2Q68_00046480 [Brassica cretica]
MKQDSFPKCYCFTCHNIKNDTTNNVIYIVNGQNQYAVGYIQNRGPIYGTRATLNVWEPQVEAADDFSLSQVWLASGSFANGDVNTVEAGWQVSS